MTADGWRNVVQRAAEDERARELLVQLLVSQDAAKAELVKHFGAIGMPWPELVNEIVEAKSL